MTLETSIEDAHQLTLKLKEMLGKDKVLILGHSWGTVIGLHLAERYPDDYLGYIGIGQLVHPLDSHILAYRWVEGRIDQLSRRERRRFVGLGDPPFLEHHDYVAFAKIVDQLGGGMDVGYGKLFLEALKAGHYRPGDYRKWLEGANRGSGPMWESYLDIDIKESVPVVGIPLFFMTGQNDYNTPSGLLQEYYRVLDAPNGKEMILFENSSHTPFWGEPERFLEEMNKIRGALSDF